LAKSEPEPKSELLQVQGLGPGTLAKLEESGITTLMGLAVASPSELAALTGISESSARKIIKNARELVSIDFEKATSISERQTSISKLSTDCAVFDTMIGGGFEPKIINEIYGQYGTGKTNLCHLLVVKALATDETSKALYIDTENCFRTDRIRDFATAVGINSDNLLERIFVARALNSEHQELLLDKVQELVQSDNSYKIIIVDSLTSHYRSEFQGRGTLANRQSKINLFMHKLLKIADIYNLYCFITNQVMSDPGTFYGNPIKPIGGNIVGHMSNTRISLRPGKESSIHAKLEDSPNLPNGECNYWLVKEGITDVKPK